MMDVVVTVLTGNVVPVWEQVAVAGSWSVLHERKLSRPEKWNCTCLHYNNDHGNMCETTNGCNSFRKLSYNHWVQCIPK